ncbi:hypothetical protein [Nocardia sp. NPDC055049]
MLATGSPWSASVAAVLVLLAAEAEQALVPGVGGGESDDLDRVVTAIVNEANSPRVASCFAWYARCAG